MLSMLTILPIMLAMPLGWLLGRWIYGPMPEIKGLHKQRILRVQSKKHHSGWRGGARGLLIHGVIVAIVTILMFCALAFDPNSLAWMPPGASFLPMSTIIVHAHVLGYRSRRLTCIELLRDDGNAAICPHCSYDLSESTTRCPECGNDVPPLNHQPDQSLRPCPVCAFLVFQDPPGSGEHCYMCKWQDDAEQLANPSMRGGANGHSLVDARKLALRKYPAEVTERRGARRAADWSGGVDADVDSAG